MTSTLRWPLLAISILLTACGATDAMTTGTDGADDSDGSGPGPAIDGMTPSGDGAMPGDGGTPPDMTPVASCPGPGGVTGPVGTIHYISPTGNDANSGTAASPWKTLKKATSTVTTAGDVIHVNAGTYSESQQCDLAVGVSIEGDGVATTIIEGAITASWTPILSLESPDKTNGNQSISKLTFDGQYVSSSSYKTWVAIWVTGRSNVVVHDTKIINFKQRGVIFNGINTTDPGKDIGGHATGNKFYNNTLANSAAMDGGNGQGALNIGFQDGMEICNNTLQQTERPEGQNGWPIKYWNQGWLKGCKIYDNIITKKPYGGSYPGENGSWDFAIEIFNAQGLEIARNTIQGSIDLNLNYKTTYPYSSWIHDNKIDHAVQNTKVEGAIIFEFRTESALVERNVINNKTYGISFNTRGVADYGGDNLPNPGGQPVGGYSYLVDNVIRNNVFTNMYVGTGIGNRFAVGVISEGSDDPQISNMQVYNNTIVAKAGDAPGLAFDFTSGKSGNMTGLVVRDNIVVGFADAWLRGSSPTHASNVDVRNNLLFQNGSSNAISWPGGNPMSPYTYTGNLMSNPLLDASFVPGAGSPAINAGTDGKNIGHTGGP